MFCKNEMFPKSFPVDDAISISNALLEAFKNKNLKTE